MFQSKRKFLKRFFYILILFFYKIYPQMNVTYFMLKNLNKEFFEQFYTLRNMKVLFLEYFLSIKKTLLCLLNKFFFSIFF